MTTTVIDPDWITVDVIKQMLSSRFKTKEWQEQEILEWCMEVETMHLVDVDTFAKFVEVCIPVQNKRFRKPCNLYRWLDIYSSAGDPQSKVNNDTRSLTAWVKLDDDFTGDYVYVNYIGTKVDELTGQPLINRYHRLACMFYCAQQAFMEESMLGIFPAQAYQLLQDGYSAACYNAADLEAYRNMQRQDFTNLSIIQGNALPRIGNLTLYQQGMGE